MELFMFSEPKDSVAKVFRKIGNHCSLSRFELRRLLGAHSGVGEVTVSSRLQFGQA